MRRIPMVLLLIAALTVPLPAAAAPAELAWGACPGGGGEDGMECATLTVPLDWSRPNGRTVTLMLGRLRADGPAQGSVLVNYGGPGASGIRIMRDTPGPQPFGRLRHRMNIVTWDPRGYPGLSTPRLDFSCLSTIPEPLRRTPPLPRGPAEFARLADDNRTIANACRAQDPELFDHMDTAANVRDMEAIRRALGERRINLYMGSYGGVYGQDYARLFPGRIRTMVLDGTGNHSGDFEREQEAIAADNVVRMHRFARWCASDRACVLHGRDVVRVWRRLVAGADRAPIPVPPTTARFDGWELRQLATGRLVRAGVPDWPRLARDIQAAERGDASGFAFSPDHPYPSTSYPVSECREWPRFTGYRHLAGTIARLDRIDPDLGAAGTMISFTLACVGWPSTVHNAPQHLPAGTPPLLGVGTWGDFGGTNRVVQTVQGGTSIYHDGPGHELYVTGNACVIGHADTYLTTGMLPPKGTRC